MTLEETKTILIMIATAYPQAQFPEGAPRLWHEFLKDYETRLVIASLKKHIATNKWTPTIAEITQEIDQASMPTHLLSDAQDAIFDRDNPISAKVWRELEARYGPYGQWQTEDNKWRFKEFIERYDELKDREVMHQSTKRFAELHQGGKREELTAGEAKALSLVNRK
jgi:hypothetical protein